MIFLPREMFESQEEYEECQRIREGKVALDIKDIRVWFAEVCQLGNVLFIMSAWGDRWGPWSLGTMLKLRIPGQPRLDCPDKANAFQAILGQLDYKELPRKKRVFVVELRHHTFHLPNRY